VPKLTLQKIRNAFPGIWVKEASDFYGREVDGFWFVADDGYEVGGIPLADYYDYPYMDPQESLHVGGIHKKMVKFLGKYGYHAEWYDPGTWMALRG
jgi:hypothetical protein